MKNYPKPSNGSLICTFADCPDREEHIKGIDGWGSHDTQERLCPDGDHLSARITDYSLCLNHNGKEKASHQCRIGRGGIPISTKWCEAALCAGVCHRGFKR